MADARTALQAKKLKKNALLREIRGQIQKSSAITYIGAIVFWGRSDNRRKNKKVKR